MNRFAYFPITLCKCLYSICFAETDVAIVKVSRFTAHLLNQCCTFALSPSGPIRKHLGFAYFFPLPLEVTVSANLLVGRHQSFALQNTNLLLLCSCKEWPALLMQSRCQINAWRETCTMAAVVKPVGGALHAFIGSMRWNTGKVWRFFFKVRVWCEEFHMQCLLVSDSLCWWLNLNYILCLRSLLSARHGRSHFLMGEEEQVLTLAAFHEDVTCDVSSRAPDNKKVVIKCYYLLYSNHIRNSYVVPFFFFFFKKMK